MLFHTETFLLWFLPIVLAIYLSAPKKLRVPLLVIASYIFYAWANPFYIFLIVGSTLLNYFCVRIMEQMHGRARGVVLGVGITANVLLLGFFKYYGFFNDTVASLLGHAPLPILSIVLPIGISFYTFEGISYCVDCYRDPTKRAHSLLEFAWFLSFFPHLVAGPIIRFHQMAQQLPSLTPTMKQGAEGIWRFVTGLAKKVLLADSLASFADPAFTGVIHSAPLAWIGILAYTLQLYFDFSAYTDMAIGLGLMFGLRLPENFQYPYFSESITDFWRRWHMSLSSWCRDYIYIPLGGNRSGLTRTVINLMITMMVMGLWHGARWTFVLWGIYHGVLLAGERVCAVLNLRFTLPLRVRQFITFAVVALGWILFRSQTLTQAIHYAKTLVTGDWSLSVLPAPAWMIVSVLAIGYAYMFVEPAIPRAPTLYRRAMLWGIPCLFLICLVVVLGRTASPFLYFQF